MRFAVFKRFSGNHYSRVGRTDSMNARKAAPY
jgi:hypothetical protein